LSLGSKPAQQKTKGDNHSCRIRPEWVPHCGSP
jgi:hypothetical protein